MENNKEVLLSISNLKQYFPLKKGTCTFESQFKIKLLKKQKRSDADLGKIIINSRRKNYGNQNSGNRLRKNG